MESRLNEKILSIQTKIETQNVVGSLESKIANIEKQNVNIESKIEKLNVGDLDSKITNNESKIEKYNFENLESKISNLESKIGNDEGKIEKQIANLESKMTSIENMI